MFAGLIGVAVFVVIFGGLAALYRRLRLHDQPRVIEVWEPETARVAAWELGLDAGAVGEMRTLGGAAVEHGLGVVQPLLWFEIPGSCVRLEVAEGAYGLALSTLRRAEGAEASPYRDGSPRWIRTVWVGRLRSVAVRISQRLFPPPDGVEVHVVSSARLFASTADDPSGVLALGDLVETAGDGAGRQLAERLADRTWVSAEEGMVRPSWRGAILMALLLPLALVRLAPGPSSPWH